ncbi:carboxylating nicotinate-nucleotide diphosphorylase [Prosthecochloris sp. N3]|uniref:nicotinate-nucleotide diphosphorylase (carboxylating) n=1 Tax=Prosthecochloris ethylica TaxID=2743976 RepID=A0ABR9XNZ1_9CHLB|nr:MULTISPECIES: carboxylating nicotinate-nucleotide diphosphorylase [Prosthecochloris]MEC9486526.1 carboxylating nicotinate-nucleotide diphosphorylase [Prosthecochloris sp.]MBF0585773.1 carboxylating nicotinate-nucleotide diphosphorylase [Prosthecochloris ethylica]MBF0635683.1 carboxylating nicotinate-nucleotide diphosphorylase [Prosthecochloris ethylica]NUK46982.1 carboxylating nicotinate-nucleotide diphosphorylase [Prosthecochloris ethylica]RNA65469.1 carboxylating nicotinate-nucleotide dip
MKQRDFHDFFEMCRTRAIMQALEEDRYDGDVTTLATIEPEQQGSAVVTAKSRGVLSGVAVARQVFGLMDESIDMEVFMHDGALLKPGDRVLEVRGRISSLLVAERTALNFMQRMSGIATRTRSYVDRVAHTGARILDTRKTAPGLRYFDKEAVKTGGGQNHRFGLFDLVLIKDNHIDAAGGIARAVSRAREYLKEKGIGMKIETEVRSLQELREALDASPDIVLLDNFSLDETRQAVSLVREHSSGIVLEASGNVDLERVAAIAETGVDYVSVGELTHSVTALDLSMTISFA